MSKKTETKNLRSGLLKGGIETARDYARDHFVYGLRTKDELIKEFKLKSRRVEQNFSDMEDWFQESLRTRCVSVNSRKKVKYISVNCRDYSLNPIYKMWKACSFTTNDIVFFFFLLDYLTERSEPVSLAVMYDEYYCMHRSDGFQRGSAQKWLKNKGLPLGIVINEDKHNKYSLAPIVDLDLSQELLFYYSEIAPGGVVGSFILDKTNMGNSLFGFKQHYIGQAFDSEIVCNALYAIKKGKMLEIEYLLKSKKQIHVNVLPLKIYSSTQNGRQYLIAWNERFKGIVNYRLDRIRKIAILDMTFPDASVIREKFDAMRKHVWGVSFGNGELVHIEFQIKVEESEVYIVNRLYREKRCGTVSPVENNPGIFKFTADVYDAQEMFPWIRTFICRIVELKMSDKELEEQFWDGFSAMYDIYSNKEKQS